MTEMLQKNKNVANNVVNENSQDLTAQWKKGELPYAEYYIKLGGGEYTNDVWDVDGWQSFNKEGDVVAEVLAPVPSYDELQNMNEAVNQAMSANIKLVEQNAQLKEVLKKCSIANAALVSIMDWLRKSTIPEQRENCAKLFEKTQELQKQLDEVLK